MGKGGTQEKDDVIAITRAQCNNSTHLYNLTVQRPPRPLYEALSGKSRAGPFVYSHEP